MSLFDGMPLENDQPAAPVEPAYTVTIKRTSTGEDILLCNTTPPPAAALREARQRKLALFTLAEIPAMRQIDAIALEAIIATRRIMGWGGLVTVRGAA